MTPGADDAIRRWLTALEGASAPAGVAVGIEPAAPGGVTEVALVLGRRDGDVLRLGPPAGLLEGLPEATAAWLAPLLPFARRRGDRRLVLPPALAGAWLPKLVDAGLLLLLEGPLRGAEAAVATRGAVLPTSAIPGRAVWVQDARTGDQRPGVDVIFRGGVGGLLASEPPLALGTVRGDAVLAAVLAEGVPLARWGAGPTIPPEAVAGVTAALAARGTELPAPTALPVHEETIRGALELRVGTLGPAGEGKRLAHSRALGRRLGLRGDAPSSPRAARAYIVWSDGERTLLDGPPRKELRSLRGGALTLRRYVPPDAPRGLAALRGVGLEKSLFEAGAWGLPDELAWVHFLTGAALDDLRAVGFAIVFEATHRAPVLHRATFSVRLTPRGDEGRWFAPQVQILVPPEAALAARDPQALLAALRAGYRAARERLGTTTAIPVALRAGPILTFDGDAVERLFSVLTELLDDRDDGPPAPPPPAGSSATDDGAIALATHHLVLSEARAALLTATLGDLAGGLRSFRATLAAAAQGDELPPSPRLLATLRPYQRAGQSWLRRHVDAGLGAVLADGMGLGKTVQALALLAARRDADAGVSLVVCPTSVVPVWIAAAAEFAPSLRVRVHHGARREAPTAPGADVVLTAYPLLARDEDALCAARWDVVVFDEGQYLKNPKTRVRDAAARLPAHARVVLTGTPLENHLGELWSLVDLVAPGLLGEPLAFQRVFRAPIEGGTDPRRLAALRARIAPVLLRRRKEDVLHELPPKTIVDVPVALSIEERTVYEGVRLAMERKVRATLDRLAGGDRDRGAPLVVFDALLKLRQCCCDAALLPAPIAGAEVPASSKREQIVADLVAAVAEGRAIVVFSQFVRFLDRIAARLAEEGVPFERLQGDTRDRAAPVARFQAGEVPILLVSLRAGGTGLTLTAADTVFHADPWWNPAVEDQATDRAHRIGQERPLLVRRYVVADSVEEKLLALQQRKRELAAAALAHEERDEREAHDAEAGGRDALSLFDVDELVTLFAR